MGAVLALLIGNVYMVPILGIGFSLIPIWYLRSTAASYKKHLNEELETAISIITTSYLSLIHILELPGQQPCAYFLVTSDQDSTFDFLASLFLSFCFIKLVRYADHNLSLIHISLCAPHAGSRSTSFGIGRVGHFA